MKLVAFLDELEKGLEQINAEYEEAMWKKYLHKPCRDINEIERKRSEILLNDHYFHIVNDWATRTRDQLLAKRLRNVKRLFLRERIEALPRIFLLRNKISEEHVKFKPVVLGKAIDRTDVNEMLRKDPNPSRRRAAWESSVKLSRKIEKDVKELMKLRNHYAQELGYKTYVDYSLSLDIIDKAELLSCYKKLDKLSRPFFRLVLKQVKERLAIRKLEAWDIVYAFDQFVKTPDKYFPKYLIVQKGKELVRSFGIYPEKLPILVKRGDIPFGGLCFNIKIPTDIRIVLNPRDGHKFYSTFFHEYGHALHACFIRQTNYAHKVEAGCFSEGMACILQNFASDYDWLRKNTSIPNKEILRFIKAEKALRLLRIRDLMASSIFEFQAYENPDQNLNKLWSRTRAKYLFISENKTPQWAAQAMYTSYPVYFQNYILAEMIAAQTIAYLKEKYGKLLNNRGISKFLIENYYSPGSSIDWPEKIRRATGQKLSAQFLVQLLTT